MAMSRKKISNKKDVNYYLGLPWTYTVELGYDKRKKYYIVRVNELLGVCTDAPTIEEAMELIKEAMTGVFELYMAHGEKIPEPTTEEEKANDRSISYNMSISRYRKITKEALKRKLTLNKTIDVLIDKALKTT